MLLFDVFKPKAKQLLRVSWPESCAVLWLQPWLLFCSVCVCRSHVHVATFCPQVTCRLYGAMRQWRPCLSTDEMPNCMCLVVSCRAAALLCRMSCDLFASRRLIYMRDVFFVPCDNWELFVFWKYSNFRSCLLPENDKRWTEVLWMKMWSRPRHLYATKWFESNNGNIVYQ